MRSSQVHVLAAYSASYKHGKVDWTHTCTSPDAVIRVAVRSTDTLMLKFYRQPLPLCAMYMRHKQQPHC